MAKTTPAETVADIAPETETENTPTIFGELVDVVEPETKNKYDDTIAAMIQADKGIVLPVPTARVAIELRYFRNSANAADKTAKEFSRVVEGDVTKIGLKLVAKYNKGKNKASDAAPEATELDGVDAPEEGGTETPAV